MPALVASSEPAVGPVQRHRLTRPLVNDCPRCGGSGYSHQYLVTIDGDWANTVSRNCCADLHPNITVTVRFLSARSAGMKEPVAVIRERSRSDHRYPDLGSNWPGGWPGSTPPCWPNKPAASAVTSLRSAARRPSA